MSLEFYTPSTTSMIVASCSQKFPSTSPPSADSLVVPDSCEGSSIYTELTLLVSVESLSVGRSDRPIRLIVLERRRSIAESLTPLLAEYRDLESFSRLNCNPTPSLSESYLPNFKEVCD